MDNNHKTGIGPEAMPENKSENNAQGNEILNTLSSLPGTEKKIDRLSGLVERMISLNAQVLQKRIEAVVPDGERQAVADTIAHRVSQTSCAMPKTADLAHQVAREAVSEMASNIHTAVSSAVKEATTDMQIHTYISRSKMQELVSKKAHNLIVLLTAFVASLLIVISGYVFMYHNSVEYLARQYCMIVSSVYTTTTEKAAMKENAYSVAVFPKEYENNLPLLKRRIKRNQETLRQREMEAKANKGKFSTSVPLVR